MTDKEKAEEIKKQIDTKEEEIKEIIQEVNKEPDKEKRISLLDRITKLEDGQTELRIAWKYFIEKAKEEEELKNLRKEKHESQQKKQDILFGE